MSARFEKGSAGECKLEVEPVADDIYTCRAQHEALVEDNDSSSSSGGFLCLVLKISRCIRMGVRHLLSSSGENEDVRAKKHRDDEEMRKDEDAASNPSMPALHQVYQPSYGRSHSSGNINECAWDDEREGERAHHVAESPAEECKQLNETANVYNASQSYVSRKPPRR